MYLSVFNIALSKFGKRVFLSNLEYDSSYQILWYELFYTFPVVLAVILKTMYHKQRFSYCCYIRKMKNHSYNMKTGPGCMIEKVFFSFDYNWKEPLVFQPCTIISAIKALYKENFQFCSTFSCTIMILITIHNNKHCYIF